LIALGRHFADRRKDATAAARCFQQALEASPQSLEAARPLATIRLAQQDWERAAKVLEIVVAQLDQSTVRRDRAGDRALAIELCRLGRACEQGGQSERALQAFTRAAQVDSNSSIALGGKARLLAVGGRLEEALGVYGNLLLLQGYSEGAEEVHARMGDLYLKLGQTPRAREHFERAVAMQPKHEHALRALINLADEAGQVAAATSLRERLISALEGPAKLQACMELGSLSQQRGDLARAMDAFNTALEIDPNSLSVLARLFQVYRTARSTKAVEVLERMLAAPDLKQDREQHKRWLLTLGQLATHELHDVDRAVNALQAALEIDPEFEAAYEALEQLLSAHRRWTDLEHTYERIISGLGNRSATHAARMRWWRKLGELRHAVLHNAEGAREALQHAAEGSPDDPDVQELFAAVAAKLPGHDEAAREAYRRALLGTSRPSHVGGALADLLVRGGQRDTAYLGLRAMEQWAPPLFKGHPAFLEQVAPLAADTAQAFRALTSPLWQQHLLHPSLRNPTAGIFALVFRSAGLRYSLGHSAYGLNPKKHRVDPAASPRLASLRYSARLLAVDGVEVLSLVDPTGPAVPAETAGPALVPCLTEPLGLQLGSRFWSAEESLYPALLAYGLASLRPELILARTLSPERLEQVLLAAVRLVTRRDPPVVDLRAVKREQRILEKSFEGPALQALSNQVRAYLTQPDSGPPETRWSRDVMRYVQGAELSCLRAAFFATADASALQRLSLAHGELIEHIPEARRPRELLYFAFSPDLHTLRKAAGTAVEG
jgi:tetratricopeptide (TPR) repeat protein